MTADKAKRTLLGIDIPRDELVLVIAQECLGMRKPPNLDAAQALDQLRATQPDIIASFYRAADAAVIYFHACIQTGKQPS